MRLVSGSFSETGKIRSNNQDAVYCSVHDDRGLFLVADGMGGHSEGERASGSVLKAVAEWWREHMEEGGSTGAQAVVEELKELFGAANRRIRAETRQESICGTTFVLLWIQKDQYALLWAGDSRCYLTERHLLGVRCRQLTTDDVWENQPDVIAELSAKEIERHPDRGKLVRAIGASENFQCSVSTGTVRDRMLFTLCSDGVYKYLGPGEMESILRNCARTGSLEKGLECMKKRIYENGAPDNLSCVMARAEG